MNSPLSRICYIIVFTPLILFIVEIVNFLLISDGLKLVNYKELNVEEIIIYFSHAVIFTFVSLISYLIIKKIRFFKNLKFNKSIFIENNNSLTLLISVLFLSIAIKVLLSKIFSHGALNYITLSRTGEMNIGFTTYFIIKFFPVIIAQQIKEGFNTKIILISLLILVAINLLTGYRLSLIVGAIYICLFNYDKILSNFNFRFLSYFLLFVIFTIGINYFRIILVENKDDFNFLSSINRTTPMVIMSLADEYDLEFKFLDQFKFYAEHIYMTFYKFGLADLQSLIEDKNTSQINSVLFSEFLNWRGTPNYEPSGFSISIISYSYIFGRFWGIVCFSFFYGAIIGVGSKLLKSKIFYKRLWGCLFLTFCIFCNESVYEASKFLIHLSIFIFFIIICHFTIHILSYFILKKTN